MLSAALVEREAELDAVELLLEAARRGAGAALVVEGPAGIGKSSLLAAAREAGTSDLRVVSARGGELERDFPFGVVRQLLEPVVVGAGAAERATLLEGAAGLAEPVLRVLTSPALRAAVVSAARADALARFGMRQHADAIMAVYDAMLGHAPSRPTADAHLRFDVGIATGSGVASAMADENLRRGRS